MCSLLRSATTTMVTDVPERSLELSTGEDSVISPINDSDSGSLSRTSERNYSGLSLKHLTSNSHSDQSTQRTNSKCASGVDEKTGIQNRLKDFFAKVSDEGLWSPNETTLSQNAAQSLTEPANRFFAPEAAPTAKPLSASPSSSPSQGPPDQGNGRTRPAYSHPRVQTRRGHRPTTRETRGVVRSSTSSNDMAAGFQRMSGDARRYPSSSASTTYRSENRAPMSNVLCRNGPQCRKFQEGNYPTTYKRSTWMCSLTDY